MKITAIIPARGGSKSIPRKNILRLGGAPLIAYSIAAGLESKYIDRVIVSTDDEEIAEVSKSYGAEVPFMRPENLAGDAVTDFPVFEHAVRWLELVGNDRPDLIVQLRPTSPFRPVQLVDEAIEKLLENDSADSVRAVTPSGENPFKMWRIEEGKMTPLMKTNFAEPYNMPRQKLPATFWQSGHVEVIRYATIIEKKSMTGDVILPIEVPREFAIDLDNLRQWEYAEHVLENWDLDMVIPTNLPADPIHHKWEQPNEPFDFF